MNRKLQTGLGAAGTLLLSLIIIYIYFYPDINHLNSRILISNEGGDGLKAYYCYLYHIDHDSSFLSFEGMNYPYGESIFYTDNQPLLSEIMRISCKVFPDLSNYAIGVWNALILLSIALGALSIFLVLAELGLPAVMSIVAGIGISFLSPQIGRLGAHYSLTYIFVIPLIFYLLLKFSKKQSLLYSIGMGCLVLWGGLTHMYFVAMLAMVILLFWIFFMTTKPKVFTKWKTLLINVLIQLILPIIIIQLLAYLSSDVIDRGKAPYGFLVYLAHPFSVFFPINRIYGAFFADIIERKGIDWEGISYIGLIGGIAFLLFIVKNISQLIRAKFKTAFLYDNNYFLTFMFWGSFLTLLYSFGVPFIFGLENLVDYLGPIKQIRSIGRFAWIFYYAINILAVYTLWDFYKRKNRKLFPVILIVLSLSVLILEAHLNFEPKKRNFCKEYPRFTEYRKNIIRNPLLENIDPSEYQSILPLPYFHIGSENIWKRPACKIKEESFEISLQTGLPLHAVMMGRTSLSQTYKSMVLIWEPSRVPAILEDIPSDKPILVLSANCNQLSRGEKLIIENSGPIGQNKDFRLNSITPAKLKNMAREHIQSIYKSKNPKAYFDGERYIMPDTCGDYIYQNYSKLNDSPGFVSKGTKMLPMTKFTEIFRDSLPDFKLPADICISFWVKDINADTKPRPEIETATIGTDGKINKYLFASFGRNLAQIHDNWGLIEYQVRINPGEELSIVLFENKSDSEIEIDDLLIRNITTDVYGHLKIGDWMCNNRYYPKTYIK